MKQEIVKNEAAATATAAATAAAAEQVATSQEQLEKAGRGGCRLPHTTCWYPGSVRSAPSYDETKHAHAHLGLFYFDRLRVRKHVSKRA